MKGFSTLVTLFSAVVVLANFSGCNTNEDSSSSEPSQIIFRPSGDDFVLVPAATFSFTDTYVFEKGKTYSVSAMYACDHEVTQQEYTAVMGNNPSKFKGNNLPAENMNWYSAIVYCNKRSIAEGLTPCYKIGGKTDPKDWGDIPTTYTYNWNNAACDSNANGYRLPTQLEWEYLARGGMKESYTYSGSDNVYEVAWFGENSEGKTHPVKGKKKNALGLYDMSGNVWEWCGDCHKKYTRYRAKRGGAYSWEKASCRLSLDGSNSPEEAHPYVGFRVIRSAK